jgi:hypothetical protein
MGKIDAWLSGPQALPYARRLEVLIEHRVRWRAI